MVLISLWLQMVHPVAVGFAADGEIGAPESDVELDILDAVRLTLENDPNIALVEVQLAAQQGALQSARGTFDPVLSSSITHADSRQPTDETSSLDTSTLSQSIGLVQRLRSGLILEPGIDLERTDSTGPAINTATVRFTIRQPLLRDRGRAVVGAEEQANERELAAARLDLDHTIATRLAAVVSRYWQVRAAAYDLEVLRTTESSSRELLSTTRRLVDGDVTPAAEIVPLEADLASREVNRIAGEQALFAARQTLAREIGLGAHSAELPLPVDPFPSIEVADVPPSNDRFLAQALAQRSDLAAARERVAAADLRTGAARNARLPRLDLDLGSSYAGLVESDDIAELYAPLFDNVPGLSTTLGFTLSWPTRNRRAEGALIQAEATVRQTAIQVALVSNAIGADVPTALDAVRRSAEQLGLLDRAVALFEQALGNEIKKLRAGTSTVVDVITQRDRLTAAQQRRIAEQLALALAVIDLRFQTGTLYRAGHATGDRPGDAYGVDVTIDALAESGSIRRENLTTLPVTRP